MFSVITECIGFISVKVDFVACPRNGSGIISWIRSALRTYGSRQAVADDISFVVRAGITVTVTPVVSLVVTLLEGLAAQPGGKSLHVPPLPASRTRCQKTACSRDRLVLASLHEDPCQAFSVYHDQCLLLIPEHLLWYL